MGHLTHPVGIRLGVSRRWPMKGISRFQSLCEELSILLFRTLRKKYSTRFLQKYYLLYSHALVNFSDSHGKTIFKIFLYNSLVEALLYKIYKRMKYQRFRGPRVSRENYRKLNWAQKKTTYQETKRDG